VTPPPANISGTLGQLTRKEKELVVRRTKHRRGRSRRRVARREIQAARDQKVAEAVRAKIEAGNSSTFVPARARDWPQEVPAVEVLGQANGRRPFTAASTSSVGGAIVLKRTPKSPRLRLLRVASMH
jgi:hypothetical protein